MIWWFLILGVSTLVVVCVVIALYMHLRRHLQKTPASPDGQIVNSDRAGETNTTGR